MKYYTLWKYIFCIVRNGKTPLINLERSNSIIIQLQPTFSPDNRLSFIFYSRSLSKNYLVILCFVNDEKKGYSYGNVCKKLNNCFRNQLSWNTKNYHFYDGLYKDTWTLPVVVVEGIITAMLGLIKTNSNLLQLYKKYAFKYHPDHSRGQYWRKLRLECWSIAIYIYRH